jgi:hypothetical protein
MNTNDHDWIKILVSAVVGMFTGLIADPIRSLVQNRIELRRLKNAIIWDFTALATNASRVLEEKNLEAAAFWNTVELPGFDYYWEKHRELFYANPKLVWLRLQCQIIKRLRDLVEHKMKTPDEAMEKVYETVAQVKLILDMSWLERRRLARSLRTKPEGKVRGSEAAGESADSDPS